VRLDGTKQTYDGYGGSASRADNFEPVAWHQYCYKNATVEQKLDETPSKSAPNQGFGFDKLKYKEHYDEAAETKYYSIIYGTQWEPEFRRDWRLYLTANGLEDEDEYQKIREAKHEELNRMNPLMDYMNMSEKDCDAYFAERNKQVDFLIGTRPSSRKIEFSDVDSALRAVEAQLAALPPEIQNNYEIVIFGTQEKANGSVYERRVRG
jgi:hypothetical protein